MKRSEQYKQMAQDVARFRDAYQAIFTHFESVGGYQTSSLVRFRPKKGEEAEAAAASREVSQLAGRAKRAQQQSGFSRSFVAPGIGIPLDPIAAWDHSLRDTNAMPPEQVINTCGMIIGALEEKADRAAATDQTVVGRLAALAALPVRVRSIVAEDHPTHPTLGKAGFAVGVVAQVVIGVVITLLGAAALAGVTALWRSVVHSTPASTNPPAPSITGTDARASTTAPTPTHT
jgi:hypothetical protein